MKNFFWVAEDGKTWTRSEDGSVSWYSVEQPIDRLFLGNEKAEMLLDCGRGHYHYSTEFVVPIAPDCTVEATPVKLRVQFKLDDRHRLHNAYHSFNGRTHIISLDGPLPFCSMDLRQPLRVGGDGWLTCEMTIGDELAKPKIYISPRKI